jgi:hypothetical protein
MKWILLFIMTGVLLGCGNSNHGKDPLATTTSTSPLVSTGASSTSEFSSCKTVAIYSAGDTAFANQVSGTSACAGVTQVNSIKIKTTSRFSVSERFCVVPLHSTLGALPAVCGVIDGQKIFTTFSGNFDSVTLVKESQLANYLNYLKGSASYPPLAHAYLR